MKSNQSILVATDFSTPATLAVDRAARLAQEWQCLLTLQHVFNPFSWENAMHALPDILLRRDPAEHSVACLDRLRHEVSGRYGLPKVHSNLATGRAATAIAEHAKDIGASLAVIGIRGEGVVHELALGGTAVKLLRRSPCPVLVVRKKANLPYRRIAIATDFSATATRGLHAALTMFPEADHVAIHACQVPHEGRMRMVGASPDEIERYRADELASGQREMDSCLEHADRKAACGVSRVIRHGYPTAVLLDELHRTPFDLLVLGRHGQSVLDEQLLGSVSLNLVHHALCDVLLIP